MSAFVYSRLLLPIFHGFSFSSLGFFSYFQNDDLKTKNKHFKQNNFNFFSLLLDLLSRSPQHGAGHNTSGSSYASPTVRSSQRASTSLSSPGRVPSPTERSPSQASTAQLRSTNHEKLPAQTGGATITTPASTTGLTAGVRESTSTFDLIEGEQNCTKFVSTCRITDSEAIRAVDWHPSGQFFAVGSNSKLLRVFRAHTSVNNQDSNNNQTTDR